MIASNRRGESGRYVIPVNGTGNIAVADFICPINQTRRAFEQEGAAFTVWMDWIDASRFADFNRLFEPPVRFDMRVDAEGSAAYRAEKVAAAIRPVSDPRKPTALLVGRY